ncbi:unnamed protein product [Urochloa decumbens]|uniref:rRNA N-glycosylase n=1 Tax=Urochloa decumbens TaxID=240449 RepID=A0ABC8Z0F7_9POAL
MELLRILLLVSLAFAPLAQAAPAAPTPATTKVYRVIFDLATDTYGSLYAKLNATLQGTNSPRYIPPDVRGKVVLAPRRDDFTSRPRAWLMVDVKIGQAHTILAIALDDLYLLGFRNSAGDWYTVQGFGGSILPCNSTTLPFEQNYFDLVGIPGSGTPGHMELYKVPLGNQSAV